MSVSVALNGVTYTLPSTGETSWGASTTAFLQALGSTTFQKSGGTFTLTADADFGGSFGLKAAYFKTRTATPADADVVRLAHTDAIAWRNFANGANLLLKPNASTDVLEFNTVPVVTTTATQTLSSKILTPTAWVTLPTNNSWVDYGGTNVPIGYRKLPDGTVEVRGAIKNGTTVTGTVVATLPAGFRPPSGRLLLPSITAGAFCILVVNTDGTINAFGTLSATEIVLDVIRFATL